MPGILNFFNLDGKNPADGDLIDEVKPSRTPPTSSSTEGAASTVSKLGAGLAVVAAIAFAATLAPIAGTATVVGAGFAGASAIVKGTEFQAARSGEDAAKKDQRGTVDGLIEKGNAKSAEDRDAYFDKLQEMFPSEAKRIQEQRSKQESESTEAVSEQGAQVGGDERE